MTDLKSELEKEQEKFIQSMKEQSSKERQKLQDNINNLKDQLQKVRLKKIRQLSEVRQNF